MGHTIGFIRFEESLMVNYNPIAIARLYVDFWSGNILKTYQMVM